MMACLGALRSPSPLLGISGEFQLPKSSGGSQTQADLVEETGLWLRGCGVNPIAGV